MGRRTQEHIIMYLRLRPRSSALGGPKYRDACVNMRYKTNNKTVIFLACKSVV